PRAPASSAASLELPEEEGAAHRRREQTYRDFSGGEGGPRHGVGRHDEGCPAERRNRNEPAMWCADPSPRGVGCDEPDETDQPAASAAAVSATDATSVALRRRTTSTPSDAATSWPSASRSRLSARASIKVHAAKRSSAGRASADHGGVQSPPNSQ